MRLRPSWLGQDSGQALIEYALILALASLGIVSALILLQASLGDTMQATGHRIDAVAGGPAGQALPGEPVGGETGSAGPPGYGGGDEAGRPAGHGNGKGNGGNGYGNGGPNGGR